MKRLSISLAIFLVLLMACEPVTETELVPVEQRIVGGTSATQVYPFMVALYHTSYGQQFCGGTLIDDQWVLTAAHCMMGGYYGGTLSASGLYAIIGRNDLGSSSGEMIQASNIYVHPSYSYYSNYNDIALIKLKNNSSYTPAKISVNDPSSGTNVKVAGWGATYENGSQVTNLREVTLPVVSNTTCNQSYGGDIVNSQICAGYSQGGKDACQGDSGGPLFIKNGSSFYHVGVVSYGYGCARARYYGVYTRVSYYKNWIEGYTGNLDQPDDSNDDTTDDNTTDDNTTDDNTNNQTDDLVLRTGSYSSGISKGQWIKFNGIDAEKGEFRVEITGSGDADLYIKKGSEPTDTSYDCRPYLDGSNEECVLQGPGKFYIGIKGYATSSNFDLTAYWYTK